MSTEWKIQPLKARKMHPTEICKDKRLVCSCIVTCISVNRSPRKEIKEWRIVPPSWKNLRYRGPEKMTSHTLKYEENVGEEVVVDHGDVFFPRPRRREGRKKSSPVDLLKAQGQSEAAVSLCTTCSGCYGATQEKGAKELNCQILLGREWNVTVMVLHGENQIQRRSQQQNLHG
ncbi:uncharacterized protein LOC140704068 isoform X3 [Pogona vitticeps]